MRSAGLLLVVAGCGFHSSAASSPPIEDAPPTMSGSDAGRVLPDALVPDAARSTFCDPITGLVACYEFEGDGKDGSSNGLDAMLSLDILFAPGKVGLAMLTTATSKATVNPNLLFDDVAMTTVEAWIRPAVLPLSGQADVIDVDKEYVLFIKPDGTLVCDIHGAGQATTGQMIPSGAWTHVACTYDAATIVVYINGAVAGMHDGNGGITSGTNGMALAGNFPMGSELVGLIDQVRVFNVARPDSAICTDAGNPSCP